MGVTADDSFAQLAGMFVYNPTLGYEFTEVENILAFHSQFDPDTQKKYVGLMQGIVGFTSYVVGTSLPLSVMSYYYVFH